MNEDRYLINARTTNGTGLGKQVVADGKFTVKCWDTNGAAWAGATVTLKIRAKDGTPVKVQDFTEDGVFFGEIGTQEEFSVDVAGITTESLSLTISL